MSDPTIPSQDESAYVAAIVAGIRADLLDTLRRCIDLELALTSTDANTSPGIVLLLALYCEEQVAPRLVVQARALREALEPS